MKEAQRRKRRVDIFSLFIFYRILRRIYHRMKVTANIPDALIAKVESFAQGKNLTQSLIRALEEWVRLKQLREVSRSIKQKPFEFVDGFDAEKERELNRSR